MTLDVDGSAREIGYDQVAKALVQVEFNRKRAKGQPADEDGED